MNSLEQAEGRVGRRSPRGIPPRPEQEWPRGGGGRAGLRGVPRLLALRASQRPVPGRPNWGFSSSDQHRDLGCCTLRFFSPSNLVTPRAGTLISFLASGHHWGWEVLWVFQSFKNTKGEKLPHFIQRFSLDALSNSTGRRCSATVQMITCDPVGRGEGVSLHSPLSISGSLIRLYYKVIN